MGHHQFEADQTLGRKIKIREEREKSQLLPRTCLNLDIVVIRCTSTTVRDYGCSPVCFTGSCRIWRVYRAQDISAATAFVRPFSVAIRISVQLVMLAINA